MSKKNEAGQLGTALVTGASAGIGKIYATKLAERGYDVILVARREDRLKEIASDLESRFGIKTSYIAADLANAADLERVATALETDEKISMLVNSAGLWLYKSVAETSIADINGMILVNVLALSRLCRAVLPGFIARNKGTITNIGSVMGFNSLPLSTVYSGTKAYILQFTTGLQAEVEGTNVHVQLVTPAATATDMWDIAGLSISVMDPAMVMTADVCVEASLAGLDLGEKITQPSLEDLAVFDAYEAARMELFHAGQVGKPASRYKVGESKAVA